MSSLPEDPQNPANAWCEACQQSLSKSRAAAHLVSAKHTAKAKKGAAEPDPSGDAGDVADEAPEATPAAPAASSTAATSSKKSGKSASKGHGLPADPDKPGHFVCNICQVSLTPGKAEGHAETKTHQEAAKKYVSSAMKGAKGPKS